MITKEMQKALNKQINAELWSAYLYLAMSLDAEAKALRGIANWFFVQWLEEQDHARIFEEYMTDRGAKVILEPIGEVKTEWDSVLEMFEETLEHEMKVTGMIHDLVRTASRERDFATVSRLQWFVDEQVEEEKSAEDIVTDLKRMNGEYSMIRDLDSELSERTYKKATALK